MLVTSNFVVFKYHNNKSNKRRTKTSSFRPRCSRLKGRKEGSYKCCRQQELACGLWWY